jgi:peptidoglycan hydrolase CwlO-like protein
MRKNQFLVLALVMTVFAFSGCGGGQKVDADKPMDQVVAEAQKMTVNDLQNTINNYQRAIEARKADIMALEQKIKQIPVTQLLGEEAKELKADLSEITERIGKLTERLKVYANELKTKSAGQ